MHILFVSSWFPSRLDKFNGDFVQRHAKAVSTLNKVTVIFTIGDKNITKWETIEKKESKNYTEIITYFPKSKFSILNFFKKWKALSQMEKQVGSYSMIHANVIHYHMLWLVFQRIIHKKKYVITEHSTLFLEENSHRITLFQKLVYKIILQYASMVLPVSKRLLNGIQNIKPIKNYQIIPNVVDTSLFQIKDNINSIPTFLHLSMLKDSHKNISGILEAIKTVKEKGYKFRFRIGGNGDVTMIENFKTKNYLNEYIEVLNALSHKEVSNEMKNADCFVLFSNYENQPCVIVESFSCGTPVISTDVGGINEYFPKNFGILIEKGNILELTNAMIKVIEGKNFTSKETMNNYVEKNFSVKEIATQFNTIYRNVIT